METLYLDLKKKLKRLHMKQYSYLHACGLLVVLSVVDKMMKKIKKNLIQFGDQSLKLNSLNKDTHLIISVIPPRPIGNNGILLCNHMFIKKINLSLKFMLELFIQQD